MLDGYVYAVGGWEGSSRLDSVERYDPETNSWSPVASLKMAVTSPAVVAHEGKYSLFEAANYRVCLIFRFECRTLIQFEFRSRGGDTIGSDEIGIGGAEVCR